MLHLMALRLVLIDSAVAAYRLDHAGTKIQDFKKVSSLSCSAQSRATTAPFHFLDGCCGAWQSMHLTFAAAPDARTSGDFGGSCGRRGSQLGGLALCAVPAPKRSRRCEMPSQVCQRTIVCPWCCDSTVNSAMTKSRGSVQRNYVAVLLFRTKHELRRKLGASDHGVFGTDRLDLRGLHWKGRRRGACETTRPRAGNCWTHYSLRTGF